MMTERRGAAHRQANRSEPRGGSRTTRASISPEQERAYNAAGIVLGAAFGLMFAIGLM